MTKRIWLSLAILAVILVTLSFNMTSCLMLGFGNDYATKDDVEEMINKGMNGNITVEGGDNYNVTVNGTNTDTVSGAKALLSSVSIRCAFKTTSVQTGSIIGSREKFSAGSGVIYKLDKNKGDAYIITNYHVVYHSQANTENRISDNISVFLYGQESENYAISATYIGGSMNYDLAILKISGSRILAESNAMAVSLADSDNVAVLDKAIAVGNSEALGISATLGHINVDSEYITMEGADGATEIQIRVMRTDTAVNSGNSGGGLFNSKGELIGIVNAKLNNTDNMSYAIPSNFVKCVADNIIYYCDGTKLEGVYRCFLGITVTPTQLYTVYDSERGVVLKKETVSIMTVERDGLASGILEVGDVINSITVDGVTYNVDRMYTVTDSMLCARVGSTVIFNVTRNGATMDIKIDIKESSLTQIK